MGKPDHRHTLIFERLDIFSVLGLLFDADHADTYYFEISSAAEAALSVLRKAHILRAGALQVKFHLSEIRSESGESLRFRILNKDLNDVCGRIKKDFLTKDPMIIRIASSFGSARDKVIQYYLKRAALAIRKTLIYVNVIEYHVKIKKISGSSRAKLIVSRTPFIKTISGYASGKGVKVSSRGFYVKELSKGLGGCIRYLLLQPLRYAVKYTYCGLKKKRFIGKKNKPIIGAYYNYEAYKEITFDLKKKNHFFWLSGSHIPFSRALVYFQYFGRDVNKEVLEELKSCGTDFVALSDKAFDLADAPIWTPTPEYFTGLMRLSAVACAAFLKEIVRGRFEFAFYMKDIFIFNHTYAYWFDFFKSTGIRINVNPDDVYPENIAMNLALADAGGVGASYQLSDFHSLPLTCGSCADVFFSFGPHYAPKLAESGYMVNSLVFCGYVTDYVFKKLTEDSAKMRKSLTENGADFIVSFFDEHSSDDPFSVRKNEVILRVYKGLFEQVIENKHLALICKPKKPRTLRSRIAEISELMERASDTGRCVFLDDGAYASSAFPAEAAQASDVAVGLLSAGTTVLEGHLAGTPSFYIDVDGMYSCEQYKTGKDVFVFDNLEALMDKIRDLRAKRNTDKEMAHLGAFVERRDPFRDGRASERMGDYIAWLLEAFDKVSDRGQAIRRADSMYRDRWGEDKVVGIEHEI